MRTFSRIARDATMPAPPLFIADNLALDFINTVFGVGDSRLDCLGSDAQVVDWLQRAGLPATFSRKTVAVGALLDQAIALREASRKLLEMRKSGGHADPAQLNRVLAADHSYQQLIWPRHQLPRLETRRGAKRIGVLLVPIAEAVAQLIVHGDFELVRRCESYDCTLWFYDTTKAHRRRWCSMAVCGNRHKVAAFRARQRLN